MCPYAPVPYTDMLMCSLPADNQYIDYSDATDSHLIDWTILTKGVSRVVDSAIPLIRPEDVVLTPSCSPLCVVFQHIMMTNTLFFLFSVSVSLVSRLKDKDRMLNRFTYQRDCGKMQSEREGWWQSLAWTDAMLDNHHALYYFTHFVCCLMSPIVRACDINHFFKPLWTHVYRFFIYIIIYHIFLTFIFH